MKQREVVGNVDDDTDEELLKQVGIAMDVEEEVSRGVSQRQRDVGGR